MIGKTLRYGSNLLLLLSAVMMFMDPAVGGLLIYLTIVVAGLGGIARASSRINVAITVFLAVTIAAVSSHWTADGAVSPSGRSLLGLLQLMAAPVTVATICVGIGMWRRKSPW